MAKTYNTFTNVSTGDVYTAASHNAILQNIAGYRVPPMCRVRRASSNQSMTAGASAFIQWNNAAAEIDTESPSDPMWASGDNTKVTVRTAGVYHAVLSYYLVWTGAATNYQVELIKTNAAGSTTAFVASDYLYKQSTNDFLFQRIASISGIVSCSVGDYFRARLTEFGGGTSPAFVNSEYTSLTIAWLGQVS